MRINKSIQYGLLFTLYISRGGRVTIEGAAEGLSLSKSFLEQVARKLRISGVVKSIRGSNGGYELNGEPTVRDVFNSLGSTQILDFKKEVFYALRSQEHRAMYNYCKSLTTHMNTLMNRKIKNVMNELVVNEIGKLDGIDRESVEN